MPSLVSRQIVGRSQREGATECRQRTTASASRPSRWPSARSRNSSARARSCASARRTPSPPIPAISTGSVSLDYALGIGGVPRGRVIEIFGPESSGKTTLALQVIAEAQKLGGMAAFVDAEHALDAQYAAQARRRSRQPARLAARQRRAGARNRRSPRPLRRRRRRRRRLGRRARAARRNRRRDGRSADGPAGAPDVAGAPQAHRRRLEVEDLPDLHQPAPREDRRHVRQPRNHHRRPRAEVLRVGPHRHPPHRRHQGRRRRSSAAARASRSSRTRSRRRSARPSST